MGSEIFMQSVLYAFLMKMFQLFVAERFLMNFLPTKYIKKYLLRKVRVLTAEELVNYHGGALISAFIVTPFFFVEGLRIFFFQDPFNSYSRIIDYTIRAYLGYLLWQMFESYQRFYYLGPSTLIYSAITYISIIYQLFLNSCKTYGFMGLVFAGEFTMIFIAFRQFYLQAKMTETNYFKFFSLMTIITSIAYRIIFIPFFIFPYLIKEFYLKETNNCEEIKTYGKIGTLAFIVLYTAINSLWTLKYIYSHFTITNTTTIEKKQQ